MALTSTGLILTILAWALYKIYQPILQTANDPSLGRIPGPILAHYTNLILKYHVLTGQRTPYIHRLHQRYGAIVRIAPREIDAADLVSFREIHKIGTTFCKSAWYQGNSPMIRSEDTASMFEVQSNKRHHMLRKIDAPLFTPSAIAKWEDLVTNKAKLAVSKIQRDAASGSADVYKWWLFMTFDIISEMGFGQSFGQLDQDEKTDILQDVEHEFMIGGVNNELPLLWPTLNLLAFFIPSLRHLAGCFKRLFVDYGEIAVQNTRRSLEKGYKGPKTFFTNMLVEAETSGASGTTVEDVRNRAAGLTFAGTHTSAVTLTYLVWEVLRHPRVHERLLNEINDYPTNSSYERVSKIEYLDHIISETMRLWPAAPGSLYRRATTNSNLESYHIPSGTAVNTQAWTFHRNAGFFPDPFVFNPDRWVKPTQQMKDAFMPWGGGARSCIGIHLAKMELFLGAFAFFKACPDAKNISTEKDMEAVDYFLIRPRAEKCLITLL